MPELPEVETVRRTVEPMIAGRTITGVSVGAFSGVIGAHEVGEFTARVTGRRFLAARRRAKYLLLDLDDGTSLMVHLRMTGELAVVPHREGPLRFQHLALHLDDGTDLRYCDQRKFGRVLLLERREVRRLERRFGPEPLGPKFTAQYLAEGFARRPGKVKSVIMDQEFIAGVGNIYADEALFRARVHPGRSARGLDAHEVRALHRAIRGVLREGVERHGTTIQSFRDASGREGQNQEHLCVYGLGDRAPCPRCGWPLERTVVGGRGTSFCPRCQRMPGDARRMRLPRKREGTDGSAPSRGKAVTRD